MKLLRVLNYVVQAQVCFTVSCSMVSVYDLASCTILRILLCLPMYFPHILPIVCYVIVLISNYSIKNYSHKIILAENIDNNVNLPEQFITITLNYRLNLTVWFNI